MKSLLKWPDYLVLFGFLAISLGIGIYHSLTGGRQRTIAEFIMANRRLRVIPTAISFCAGFYSATEVLGLTAEMYSYGAQYMVFLTITPTISVLIVERFIVPWLYPLKLVSVFEYLEKRFMSRAVRVFAATLGITYGVLYMGVAMYAPSAALESATGLPLDVSIPLMAVVTVTFTALGGIRAVIWTDVFQFVTVLVGATAIIVKGLMLIGGISNVLGLAGKEGRLELANFSFDPRERHTVWGLLIGLGISCVGSFGLLQVSVQRFSAVDKLSKARAMVLLTIPPMIVMTLMSCIIGLIVLAYYSSINCDPLANNDITNPNMLLPYFVATIFTDTPGFSGLFLATLYGGTLSAMSSALSSISANCWEDIFKWKLNHLSEARKTLINRLLVVLLGAASAGVAFLAASFPGPITQLIAGIVSSVVGPALALFILGAVSKHANWKGALLGGIVGVVISFWLGFGSMTVSEPALPPVSVEQCSLGSSNSTFLPNSLDYNNYTTSGIADGIYAVGNLNKTNETLPGSRIQVEHQLHGIENFYAMSYLWFLPFGSMITLVIGIIASCIMRDKDLEAEVEDRLLIKFYGCAWSDEFENEDHCNIKYKASLQETETLNRRDDEILKADVEMASLKKTENGSSHT